MDAEVEALYVKWREKLLKICFFLILIILATELALFFEHKNAGDIHNVTGYVLFNIVVPTVLNFLIYFTACYVIRYTKVNIRTKNYLPVIVVTCFGGTLVIFHAVYSIVESCLMIPIMLTVIYGDRIFTRRVIVACNVWITIDFFLSLVQGFYKVEYYLFNYTISIIIYVAGCILAKALMLYETDLKDILRRSIYEKQFLQEKLKRNTLTELYTYEAFRELLEERGKESRKAIVVAVIRFDYKEVMLEKPLIQNFAKMIRMKSGLYGFAAYYGRGEFALALSGAGKKHMRDMLDDLRRSLQKYPVSVKTSVDLTSFTACISEYDAAGGETVEEFLQKMDQSLIRAQNIGGGRNVEISSSSMEL